MKAQTKLVGEFILIVVGVLVALAVETALEDRADRGLRDEYILRIDRDIRSDKTELEVRIQFFGDVQGFAEDFSSWLDADEALNHEALLAAFYSAEVWPFIPNNSTYADLLSTGNIRLIDDIELRGRLSDYHNKANRSRSGWTPTENYRRVIRGVIPSDVQSLIREHCPTTDALDETPTGFPPCELSGVDHAAIHERFELLRNDEEFRRLLTYRGSELDVVTYLLTQQIVFADAVLELIDELD